MENRKAKTDAYTGDNPKGWEAFVVREAITLLENRLRRPQRKREPFTSPRPVIQLARTVLAGREREHFWVAFLDNKNRLIDHKILFSGTVNGASVYPREVVKAGLKLNAAAVIVGHNHPSGDPTPSGDDIRITETLKKALWLVDIRLLDHIIVGAGKCTSLVDLGKM